MTEQRGDVPPARGAVFGLVAGALLSAVLLAPVASLWVVLSTLAAPTLEGVAITDIEITAALLAALVSGVVVLLGILGGALLGAIAAAVINLGFASRDLRHIGTDLHIGQAALVLRARPANVVPIVAELALRGGTPMQRAPTPATVETDDPATTTAAQFTHQSHTGTDHAHRRYMPAPLPEPLIDPRQQDMVVGLFDTLPQARAARWALRWRWPWQLQRVTGNIALISRTDAGHITYHQTENVTARRGAIFGLLTGGGLGVLLGGVLGLVLGVLFAADQVTSTNAETATGLVLGFGIGFALLAGLPGAGAGLLIGALTAGLVNLSFATADLRRIGHALPSGKAMLVMLVPHYAAAPLVETIRQRDGTLLRTPQPPADLLEDSAETIREQASANTTTDDASPDTQRLVPTRAGVRIFADWRRRDGPTIVLLHGAGGDHLAWQVQYPALHAAGYSTLALDLRGHGYSDRPTQAEDYRLERFAEDVADVLEALAIDEFIMVGHCFGGMVTTMFHRLHPTASRGYILLDTAAKAPPLAAQVSTRAPWLLHIVGHLLELLPGCRGSGGDCSTPICRCSRAAATSRRCACCRMPRTRLCGRGCWSIRASRNTTAWRHWRA